MSVFPSVSTYGYTSTENLPLCKDWKWDFTKDKAVFQNGIPVTVTGLEAVKVWCWNALKTVRKRYRIFSDDYGCDLERLIGKNYLETTKKAEAKRYVKECLMVSRYVTGVENITTTFKGDDLIIECTVNTIYGNFSVKQ
jgi:hypothetical protein